ncbi:Concanavalin A-like lectin/glucanase subgroup [Penicillium samsonianum]|uniref:Concanavalin A-like lectin/glucanase subgroup n=1 Tax=Penicillium samsonianum TaxID=1882272 RepID=UPI002548B605|nr:Concanavalin A-like lectin/glucanase subgroup [Penicillium samsonianum]KAJ6131700.1 Concanavalin A-like lectin/glucanase subgroup [Penicillium samsonianum]
MAVAHHNPIIPGFAPDPSICLIDGTFYLVNSSFHLYPGLPIYMSNDLVSWKHIGNAINRPSQLSLARATTFIAPWDDGTAMVGTGGLYAPTIRHHNGITYIICTNVIHGPSNLLGDERNEQFIIHTTDIRSGIWSDPVVFGFPGIDPSLLFDDDGRVYVQLCKTGPEFQIYNIEVDITTGTMIVEPTLIWKGWKKGYTEGPHIYKKDGWYYLLCAEGGTFRYHKLSMARSRNIWGPYESYNMNPLYTASGTTRYVQNTGHGDLFQDQNGQWWVVMLGIRIKEGRSIMGRETFLTAVDWPYDGWPTIESITCDGNLGVNFKECQDSLAAAPWVYLRDAKLDRYHIQDRHIKLQADPVEFTSPDESITFVGQRQRRLEGTATVTVYKPQPSTSVRAGLALYKDEHRFLTIEYNFHMQQVIFNGLNQAKSFSQSETRSVEFQDFMSFRISYTETSLQFFFRVDEADWRDLATVDTALLTDYDFTGPVIGIFAIGDDIAVEFGDFEVDAV